VKFNIKLNWRVCKASFSWFCDRIDYCILGKIFVRRKSAYL